MIIFVLKLVEYRLVLQQAIRNIHKCDKTKRTEWKKLQIQEG